MNATEMTAYFKGKENYLKQWWNKSDIIKVEFEGLKELTDDYGTTAIVGKFNAWVNSVHILGERFIGYSVMIGEDGYGYILKAYGGRYEGNRWTMCHRIKRTIKII